MSPAVMLPRASGTCWPTATGATQYNFIYTSAARTRSREEKFPQRGPRAIFLVAFHEAPGAHRDQVHASGPGGNYLEMEGGKPGWNDAMNGLCACSSGRMPEMAELLRMLGHEEGAGTYGRVVERGGGQHPLHGLRRRAQGLRRQRQGRGLRSQDTIAQARDDYRNATSVYFSSEVVSHSASDMLTIIATMEAKVERGP